MKATSFLFVGTHVGIYNILGCPVLRGGCKPETFFERGDAATHVSFAHVDFLDKESIAVNGLPCGFWLTRSDSGRLLLATEE